MGQDRSTTGAKPLTPVVADLPDRYRQEYLFPEDLADIYNQFIQVNSVHIIFAAFHFQQLARDTFPGSEVIVKINQ